MRVPFVDLSAQYQNIKEDIEKAVTSVISEAAFVKGKFVNSFEEQFSKLYGVKHVIGCGNGTDSLYIIMKMLGIGEGDEVIAASNSWISSSETISQTGAKPVFVDVHPTYYSMDETLLQSKITSKTKALVSVHLHGQICDMQAIVEICNRNNIYLIEDCAQSPFSEYNGKRAGLFGIAAAFSFYPSKNLGAYGDAGCIITNDSSLAEKCRMYSNHGALIKYDHQMEGVNSRLDGLQAAILSAKLPYILHWTEQRISNAHLYNHYLGGIDEISLPKVRNSSRHVFHLYVIRTKQRKALVDYLNKLGVETSIHYPVALPYLPAYKYLRHTETDFPVIIQLQDEILSLPMYAELSEEMIEYVSESIRSFFKG